MNRIVAILSVAAVLFVGLSAIVLQRDDYNDSANQSILDGINAIANASFLVMAFIGIFIGGIVVLFIAIASMGGR